MKKDVFISRFLLSLSMLATAIFCLDTPLVSACFFLAGFLISGMTEYIARRKVRKWLSLTLPVLLCALGCFLIFLRSTSSSLSLEGTDEGFTETISEVPDIYAEPHVNAPQKSKDTPSGFYVTFLDLGQSDATLITCDGQSMLVDAGNPDLGMSILTKCYKTPEFSGKLTYLVLTHPHTDHIGSAASVISHMAPSLVLLPDVEKSKVDTKCYEQLLDTMSFYNIPCRNPESGDTYTLGSAQITILYTGLTSTDDINNMSLMVYISYGNTSLLLSGDAEKEEETAALEYVKHADVFQAGHHGSATSNTKEFLEIISPKTIVISCGENNEYGHPHEAAINRMKDVSASIYRTDTGGDISFYSDGENIVFTEKPWYIGLNGTDYIKTDENEQENNVSTEEKDKKFQFTDYQNLYYQISDTLGGCLNKTYNAVFQ